MFIGVDVDDNEVKSIVKEIKEFTNKYRIKPLIIRYVFKADTYDKIYTIYCANRDEVENANYFEDEIKFIQQLSNKYELYNIEFVDVFDTGQRFSIQVEVIQTLKI